ncbi:hypothetical protein AB0L70_07845 [Kribbella sp. NPDC051952]|uniref:alpha/beta hydrolase family protein n=1 Tax=Kribbella sp. NPDC051952 TaxID=3154851 RepID=UPI00344634A0
MTDVFRELNALLRERRVDSCSPDASCSSPPARPCSLRSQPQVPRPPLAVPLCPSDFRGRPGRFRSVRRSCTWSIRTATTRTCRSWGRRPVVVFSPGFGVPRGLASISVAELAGRGYVVVTVDHTYEVAGVEFPGGRLEVQTLPEGSYALMARAARLADLRFVLDAVTKLAHGQNPDAEHRHLPAGLGEILDLRRVGAYGHSAGGLSSIDLLDVDRRVRAAINLDGPLGYGYDDPADAPTVAHGTDRPFLLMGSAKSGPFGPMTHRDEPSWGLFWDHSTGWKRDLNLPNGRHYSFIDHQALVPWFQRFFTVPPELIETAVGTANPAKVLFALRTYLPAFFDQHLRDRPNHALWRRALPETKIID